MLVERLVENLSGNVKNRLAILYVKKETRT